MKVFQLTYTEIPDEIQVCMDSVKAIYPQVEVYYKKSELTGMELLKQSDNDRDEILRQYDDILFIDWDIKLDESFIIEQNGLISCNYFKGAADLSVIYSPSKEVWQQVEYNRVNRKNIISRDTFAWMRKVLREMKTNEIGGNYEHLRYTSSKKRKK